jgi:hypothetical protein
LEKHHFRSRQAFKSEAGKKNIPQRDEQFKNIECLKQEYHEKGNPVLSMDVKKQELIGNFGIFQNNLKVVNSLKGHRSHVLQSTPVFTC